MHKTIWLVFEILIFSLIFMVLLDTTLLVVQVLQIHTQVSNMTGIMQTEVARNNCMPTEMANMFTSTLNELSERFNSGNINSEFVKFETNFTHSMSGDDCTSLAPDDVDYNYGDIAKLHVRVIISPMYIYLGKVENGYSNIFERTLNAIHITLDYEYSVPCLRYLK